MCVCSDNVCQTQTHVIYVANVLYSREVTVTQCLSLMSCQVMSGCSTEGTLAVCPVSLHLQRLTELPPFMVSDDDINNGPSPANMTSRLGVGVRVREGRTV